MKKRWGGQSLRLRIAEIWPPLPVIVYCLMWTACYIGGECKLSQKSIPFSDAPCGRFAFIESGQCLCPLPVKRSPAHPLWFWEHANVIKQIIGKVIAAPYRASLLAYLHAHPVQYVGTLAFIVKLQWGQAYHSRTPYPAFVVVVRIARVTPLIVMA